MKIDSIESGHTDRRGDTDEEHRHAQTGAEPADQLVPLNPMGPRQRRLKTKKNDPSKEHCPMYIQHKRTWRRSMNELFFYGVAEPIYHNY